MIRTPDGRVWTRLVPDYSVLRRYLSVFDRVRVVARVLDQASAPEGAARVDGEGVEVWPIPYYVGPAQYLWRRTAIGRALAGAATARDAVVLQVPSAIGSLLAASRERQRLPYALEVIGDPDLAFSPGVIRHPLRPLLRHRFVTGLRHQCRSAVAVGYETERTLQERYPPAATAPTAGISCVDLNPVAFVSRPRQPFERPPGPPRLISVGTLDQLYKGVDTLIEAVGRLTSAGASLQLVHVGIGRFRPRLEELAERWGVADRVTFTGWLPSVQALRDQLDAADLFVMPSRTEGLPRALIEAMARGLPAIASRVGGIPELVPGEDLISPNNPTELATAIDRMLADPIRMANASARNLARARDFSAAALSPRRDAFYRAIRNATDRRTAARIAL